MDKEKFQPIDEMIFCSGCRLHVDALGILLSEKEVESSKDEVKDRISTENYEEIEEWSYTEKTNVIVFYKKTFFVRCPVSKCKKEYLLIKKYPKDPQLQNIKFDEPEVIPYSYEWHLFPIENPTENENLVIPSKPFSLYMNAIACFNSELNIPCGFLIGAVIESVCICENIKPITTERIKRKLIESGKYDEKREIQVKLYQMLEDLVEERLLTTEFSALLDALRNVRNDSAHPNLEVDDLERDELSVCINSIENLFEELYIEPYKRRMRSQNAGISSNYLRSTRKARRENVKN